MALNTLETAYVNGQIIDASHVNELTLALLGQFVGRDANGVPTPNQSLGTLAIPWGNLYCNGIILNGFAVDPNQLTALPNRIVSGQSRPLSSLSDFIRANGSALEFDILGATVDLVLSINNTAVSIDSDLNKAGIVAAPAANNTADINDTTIVTDPYAGEDGGVITLDAVGSEVTNRVGQIVAFRTPTGEIMKGYLRTGTSLTNVFRGYYFDDSGNPIKRGDLSNNDTITLMNIGWVFVEDNGTTVDVTYRTPSISYEAPSSPQTGDYWFDITNQVWKRYSGVSWDIINRILIGEVIADDTAVIASRSLDFSNPYEEMNNFEIEAISSEIVATKEQQGRISVYGTEIQINHTFLTWNITTDLETGLIEASDTIYYLYISDQGRTIISDQKPYFREDLKGDYHPYESYRLIGMVYNDGSSDFDGIWSEYKKSKVIFETAEANYSSNTTKTTLVDSHFISRGRTKGVVEADAARLSIGDDNNISWGANTYVSINGVEQQYDTTIAISGISTGSDPRSSFKADQYKRFFQPKLGKNDLILSLRSTVGFNVSLIECVFRVTEK